MPSPYPTQVAAHSMVCTVIIQNWCRSLQKVQPKLSKSAMKKFRTGFCEKTSRSIGPLLAIETVNSKPCGSKSTEASVICKGKELDAEILGCTTMMRIFSWCISAKHVKLTEWGLFAHASSLDQYTTSSLLKSHLSDFLPVWVVWEAYSHQPLQYMLRCVVPLGEAPQSEWGG